MAFSSVALGETAGVAGTKKFFGTFNCASVTTGTITFDPGKVYQVVGGGVVQTTALTTANTAVQCKITAGTMVIEGESGVQGYYWVEVK